MLNKKLVLGSLAGASLLVGAAVLLPSAASAAGLMVGTCVNCHTMHDSVDGTSENPATGGPKAQLLKWNGCVGCHTGAVNVAGLDANFPKAPQVGSTASGTANAGGYFNTAVSSHNVDDISGLDLQDQAYDGNIAPGNTASFGTDAANTFTCTSCHGRAIGGHHTYTAQTNARTGVSDNSFRMLGADTAGAGTVSGSYISAPVQTSGYATTLYTGSELNTFCADCHSAFHGGSKNATADETTNAADAWIRHPTDVSTAAYAATYTTGDSGTLGWDSIVTGAGDVVMCLSCHTAHGSTYSDMLRFSYGAVLAGSGAANSNCETCHGAK